MNDARRATAREVAQQYLARGDALGWFEALYSRAESDAALIPWADLEPNPNLVSWLDDNKIIGSGSALKIGSGLGDDAEELSRRGFETIAFDISPTASAWSQRRFPASSVSYNVMDLFSTPHEWQGKFDFVMESYTLQVLPPILRAKAIQCIASFVASGGTLLVIARGKEVSEPEGKMPWPLTRAELLLFNNYGLKEVSFEDYMDSEQPPVRRFRAAYMKL